MEDVTMKLYLIRAEWIYEEDLVVVGIADAEHIEAVKEAYINRYAPVSDSIRRFEVEEYTMNEVEG